MDYFNISMRMLLAFVLVFVFFQFLGAKRQFSQMTSFDLISNFILSSIFGGFLFNPDISWKVFVIITAVYFALNWIVNYLAKNTTWGRGAIIGTPTVIIKDGELNVKNLNKMNMNMTDFMSLLRTKEVHSLADVKLAQIEVGGEITVARKGEENYAITIIENGKINKDNLKQIKKTKTWLMQQLKKQHESKVENVFYAQWQKNELYLLKYK